MKKTLLMLAMVAATSMVALAHGDGKKDGKKDACCSKDKKEVAAKCGRSSCCKIWSYQRLCFKFGSCACQW
jgi:hypothetical protein